MIDVLQESAREVIEIAQDWPCRKCGYNLYGADIAGRCPECGDLVDESISTRPAPTWKAVISTWLLVLAAAAIMLWLLILSRP